MTSMTPRTCIALLLLGLALPGCSDAGQAPGEATGIAVTVEPDTRRGGEPLTVTLRNDDDEEYGYNLCATGLEVRTDGDWQPGPESLRLCTLELHNLPPGTTRVGTYDLDVGLPAGIYRLRLPLVTANATYVQRSNAFTVTP